MRCQNQREKPESWDVRTDRRKLEFNGMSELTDAGRCFEDVRRNYRREKRRRWNFNRNGFVAETKAEVDAEAEAHQAEAEAKTKGWLHITGGFWISCLS